VFGYDEIIVLTLIDTSGFLANKSLEGSFVGFEANALAALESCKTGVEELITETYCRLERIAKLGFPLPDFGQLLIIDRDFSSLTVPPASSEQTNVLWPQQATPSQINGSLPLLTAPGWFECSGVQTTGSGYAAGAANNDNLINCLMSAEIASALYPPGCFAPVGTDTAIMSSFFFLPCFLLLQEISKYEELRRLVVVAIATLFLLLRSAVGSFAIAVCQRSFFTHHGAHPPENRSQRHLGSFSGRVFQLQVAA
jgi:hypothetical protein